MAIIDHLERDINEISISDEDKYTDGYVDTHDEEQHLNLEEKKRKERNTKSDRNRNDGNSNDVEKQITVWSVASQIYHIDVQRVVTTGIVD